MDHEFYNPDFPRSPWIFMELIGLQTLLGISFVCKRRKPQLSSLQQRASFSPQTGVESCSFPVPKSSLHIPVTIYQPFEHKEEISGTFEVPGPQIWLSTASIYSQRRTEEEI